MWFICWLIGCCVPLWTLQLIKAAVSFVAAHSFGGWPISWLYLQVHRFPADIHCAATTSITSLTSWLMSLHWPVWLEAHGQMAELFIKMIEAWPHSYDVKELSAKWRQISELDFYTLCYILYENGRCFYELWLCQSLIDIEYLSRVQSFAELKQTFPVTAGKK